MDEKVDQSKKPENSDFKQQRLKAWQPLLTPTYVIATFAIIGLIFIPIGIVIVVYSNRVVEVRFQYDGVVANNTKQTIEVTIPKDMKKPIYFYYELSNYYQNHRRYVKSRSDAQLRGNLDSGISSCDPIERNGNKTIVPCGLIANSFFNDTFSTQYCPAGSSTCETLTDSNWDKNGIAWSSDKKEKFKANNVNFNTSDQYTNIGYFGNVLPAVDDEELMVWMRTAGLPKFKKLHRIIRDKDFSAGDIVKVTVGSYYPVDKFDGSKAFVFSTTSWLGGKNDFLGWAYITVGILSILLSIGFAIKHKVSPRKLGDMSYFNWATQANAQSEVDGAE